jgi:hypothetical protein
MLSLMEVYSMTDTTPLSPAAQAVLDALHTENSTGPERYWARANAVAALRAAADQVVPIRLIDELDFSPGSCCERVLREERAEMRNDLLAIAAELEGSND